jgi:allantoinase
MPDYDVLIRGGAPWACLGIVDGTIAGFDEGSAREEIDASGLLVLPGVVDAHVHFNEPGRTEWEGWATGSRAAVAGGVTTVCDMPLNSRPPVVTSEAFHAKRTAAEVHSVCDFALWGGLIPGRLDHLERLAECGVIGFKAFMCDSGVDDFPSVDCSTLAEGMRRASRLGLPVAVHAELNVDLPRRGTGIRDYLASHPIESECQAIAVAIDLAGETGCSLHVVHVSSGRALSIVVEARGRGVDVTAETCPHYLVLSEQDLERLGAVAKCAPPLRPEAERLNLLEQVRAGRVDILSSDHSPSPPHMKEGTDFFRVWGGIAGVQHLLPLAVDLGLDAGLIARLTAENVTARFRLARKGRLASGYDADLTLVDVSGAHQVSGASLFSRHQLSPYVGRTLRARVRRTVLRGRTVCLDGRVMVESGGRLLTPSC